MGAIIGIDLGTTNSCLAVIEGPETRVLENSEGGRTTPSVVALGSDQPLVGDIAKRQAALHPEETIFSIKRFIGRHFDPAAAAAVPYRVEAGKNNSAEVEVNDRRYSPEEISALILQKLKAEAERKLGQKVTAAVITVPAYFDDAQRQATKDAGRIAGLEVKRIINEPTAAALAYGFNQDSLEQRLLVVDLGGGTLDVSALEIGEGVVEVLATSGDNQLGGDDFDQAVASWLNETVKEKTGLDLNADPGARQRLIEAAEKAKIELSSKPEAQISIPFISSQQGQPVHIEETLSRAHFHELVEELIEKIKEPILTTMKEAPDLEAVLLVGGMTRVPAVYERIAELTGIEPHRGANPDEVVARGAALQAGVLAGAIGDILLVDVTPLALGIETKGGLMTTMFARNTTIPARQTEIFSTSEDNQASVDIHVVQGQRELARFNRSLGRFVLTEIPPAARGVPEIEVQFEIDANGILQVSAREITTGAEQSIEITGSSGLSEEEIEALVLEAERHAESDLQQRQIAELINEAEQRLSEYPKRLGKLNELITESERNSLEAEAAALRQALDSGESAALRSGVDNLMTALRQLAEKIDHRGENLRESGPGDL